MSTGQSAAADASTLPGASGARPLGHGIFSIDAGYLRAEFDAIHVLVHHGRAMLIDTGTARSCGRILAALTELGIDHDGVDAVALTHVHLDHAGGAGSLMQALPQATLLVHPRGARHMIEPAKLWAGTVAVYGQEQSRLLYGEPVPVAASRVRVMQDGASFSLAGRRIQFIDAPGHARHHHVLYDHESAALFTGDTFGIAYPQMTGHTGPIVFPSSTPVQFDPNAMRHSVRRILSMRPSFVLLTHYSRHDDVAAMGAQLLSLIDQYEALGNKVRQLTRHERLAALEAGMRELLFEHAHRRGFRDDDTELARLIDGDISLNAAGLNDWLEASTP